MFDVVNKALSAAVATNGTFTVAYSTGRSAGSYTQGHAHKMFGLQTLYVAPKDFTISFGATEATVTWKGSTTLPVNTALTLELDRLGDNSNKPENVVVADTVKRASIALIDLGSPAAANSSNISASQTVTGAGTAFLLNGTTAGILDVARNVVAAWSNTAVLTITGKDPNGNTVVETSASGTSHTGKKAFKSITSVKTSATVTGATAGTGDVLGLPVRVSEANAILAEIKDGVALARKPRKVTHSGRVLLTDGTYGVVHVPFVGTIKSIRTVEIDGTIATNDAILTFKIGTTAITTGVVTIATSGSAAGVKDSASPTAANVLAAGDAINVTVSGTPGGGKSAAVEIEVELSDVQALDGTFVAAVDTAPTGTTGDVYGTYDPVAATDGALAFQLLVALSDPADRGVAQFTG